MDLVEVPPGKDDDAGNRTSAERESARTLSAVSRYRHPVAFYLVATAVPWAPWFVAAWLSHRPQASTAERVAMAGVSLAGLVAPVLVAVWFIRRDGLSRDVIGRLLAPPGTRTWHWLAALFLLPASLLVATAVSVAFGYDVSQFQLRDGFSFTAGLLPVWITLALAPVLEELAWHAYGTDALATRMRVLWESFLAEDFEVVQEPVQAPTYSVVGTVTDDDGTPVPGTVVTVTDTNGEQVAVVTTGDDGTWSADLPPGVYTATITPPARYVVDGAPTLAFEVTDVDVTGLDFVVAPQSATPEPSPSLAVPDSADGPGTGGAPGSLPVTGATVGSVALGALLAAVLGIVLIRMSRQHVNDND